MTEECPPPEIVPSPQIDTTISHPARIWDHWLGGKDNYPVDRQVGDRIAGMLPEIVMHARANRMFLGRAVRFLAGDAGIRQFLDIGAGLPTVDNTHEVAQRVVPECRVVYVDNDPLVLVHANALLTSSPQGATGYLHADLRDPGDVLADAARTLDLTEPVAIMILGVLWHILADEEAAAAASAMLDIATDVRNDPEDRLTAAWSASGTGGRAAAFKAILEIAESRLLDMPVRVRACRILVEEGRRDLAVKVLRKICNDWKPSLSLHIF